jgi:two-component system heavy metal sensor histidine kinase CusS
MSRYSLTFRLALLFASLSFVVLATVGIALYRGLEAQLILRDDAALVTRVDHIRILLQDADVLELIRDKPHIFENMLGNNEALLQLKFAGKAPLIEVNPGHVRIPELIPVSAGKALSLTAVHHTQEADGTPFIAVAASARTMDPQRDLIIVSGRQMTERTRLLAAYRDQILLFAFGAAVLIALAAFLLVRRALGPLRRLAAETDSINIKNLSSRIDNSGMPDELAPLVDSFNAMLDRLVTGFAQLSQVSADMAHDLRTPIGNLLGQTEVALNQRRGVEYYEKLLGSNFEELQRLSKMTDNMLFLARAENAETAIDRKILNVFDELQRIGDYFEGLATERDLRLTISGNGTVLADPMLLQRAMANLIANAIRYADPDTDILLVSEQHRGGTTLTVENCGPTIEEAHLTRIFDRFYRADAARRGSAEASGLGLSIVRSIMMLHHGSYKVTSREGKTRFTLEFPLKASK